MYHGQNQLAREKMTGHEKERKEKVVQDIELKEGKPVKGGI